MLRCHGLRLRRICVFLLPLVLSIAALSFVEGRACAADVLSIEFYPGNNPTPGGFASWIKVNLTGPADYPYQDFPTSTSNSAVATFTAAASPTLRVYGGDSSAYPIIVNTSLVSTSTNVTLSVGGVQTVLTVLPIQIASLSVPQAIVGGSSFGVTVTLNFPAPADNATVNLTSSNPSVLQTPNPVLIFWGEYSDGTAAGSSPVTAATPVTITASYNGSVASAVVMVDPGYKSPEPASPAGNHECIPVICQGLTCACIDPRSGNAHVTEPDPIATRGYPLTCDISYNSQGVETGRSMGNMTFTYDMHVAQQTIYSSPGSGALHWVVMDGDGTRLDFGPASGNPSGMAGIFSHLTLQNGGGYALSGAGPPGDVKSAGNFSYSFDSNGRLTQIQDSSYNLQSLTYTNGQLTRVLDVNTGKQITFNWSGGFITQVVEGGGAAVRNLSYVGGQLTSLAVINEKPDAPYGPIQLFERSPLKRGS